MRTAHVGNQRPYNLAVAEAGLPMQLVDHTIVAQQPGEPGDNNYLPGSIVTAEAVTPLELVGPPGRLTSKTRAAEPETGQAVYLDQLHITSLRQAFPANPSIRTNTEYIRNAEVISGEVIKIALDTFPQLFTRVVQSDGTVSKVPYGHAVRYYPHYGILQLNDDPRTDRGILVPNEVDIVLGFVVEALTKGGDTQYHLSGPDFYQYIKDHKLQQTLNLLYAEVRREASFGSKLPETLNVRVVPAAEARFASARGNGDSLHKIFGLLREESSIRYSQSVHHKSLQQLEHGPSADAIQAKLLIESFIAENQREQNYVVKQLGRAALEASELFVGPREAPFTSQYDVLASNGLDMPPENLTFSTHQLHVIHHRLQGLRKKAMQ